MWNKIKRLFKLSQKEYACNVYRTAAEYKIITESKTNTGLFMEYEPIFIISISSPKEKKNKYLAYIQTLVDIMVPIVLFLLQLIFLLNIDYILNHKNKAELYLLSFIYIVLPLFIILIIIFSPKKIIINYRKYTYSKMYIWHLKSIYVGSILLFILLSYISNIFLNNIFSLINIII